VGLADVVATRKHRSSAQQAAAAAVQHSSVVRHVGAGHCHHATPADNLQDVQTVYGQVPV
jgi:hypothetical protein